MLIGEFLDQCTALVERQQQKEDARQSGLVVRELPLYLSPFHQGDVPIAGVLYFYDDRVVLAEAQPQAGEPPAPEA